MIRTSAISTQNFFVNAFDKVKLTDNRKNLLLKISKKICNEYKNSGEVYLNFICTDNAIRSQFAQVWSFFASDYFKLNIKSFSGGTEVTNLNRKTIKTLQKAGFIFQLQEFSHQNSTYDISYSGTSNHILGFSKLYNNSINKTPFIAITLCNHADRNCPQIPEALEKFYMPFLNLKFSDRKNSIDKKIYTKTNQQIAAEIFYIFSEAKKYLH